MLGKTTSFKLDPKKASEPISVTPSGITSFSRPVFENILSGIVFQLPRNTTSLRFHCPWNALSDELICAGKLTLVRVEGSLVSYIDLPKALNPIFVTLSGI